MILQDAVTDPVAIDPALVPVAAAIDAHDPVELRELLSPELPDAVRDAALDYATDRDGIGSLVSDLEVSFPDDRSARLLRAAERFAAAWTVRGSGSSMTADVWDSFREMLEQADTLLLRLAAEYPTDAVVAAYRVRTSLGLELGASETARRYDRLTQLGRPYYWAAGSRLQSLGPKWGGSFEEMFGFARELVVSSPGTLVPALVTRAHLERWVTLEGNDLSTYFTAPSIADELAAAAQASVFHSEVVREPHWVLAHTEFAVAHVLGGRDEWAKVHFRLLGRALDPYGYAYLGEPSLRRLAAVREVALREGAV